MRQCPNHHRRPRTCPKANAIHSLNPEKIQIWGGISWAGPKPFVLFDINLKAEDYEIFINVCLAPITRNFNNGEGRKLQDNAPTHVTSSIHEALKNNCFLKLVFQNSNE